MKELKYFLDTFRLYYSVILCAFCIIGYDGAPQVERLIFYGNSVNISQYPFFADLDICGGAIISPQWILTAAHCIYPNQRYVWVGGNTIDEATRVKVKSVIIHPLYELLSDSLPVHDIGLIQLKQCLKFNKNVRSIGITKIEIPFKELTTMGRGRTQHVDRSKLLQAISVQSRSVTNCIIEDSFRSLGIWRILERNMDRFSEMTNTVICAGRAGLPGVCHGDSGSPLVHEATGTVVGLTSYLLSSDCVLTTNAYYTKVGVYYDWIHRIMNNYSYKC